MRYAVIAMIIVAWLTCGCRTAGTADQTAKVTFKNVTVTGTVTIGGDGSVERVRQMAGKEVGVGARADASAVAADNAVAGGDATREGDGGSPGSNIGE